MKGESY